MLRYFFDFFDGATWSQDDVGIELDSAEKAYLEAYEGARGMWAELMDGKRNPGACAFDVRGPDGQSLFRFHFTELLGIKSGAPAPDVPGQAAFTPLTGRPTAR